MKYSLLISLILAFPFVLAQATKDNPSEGKSFEAGAKLIKKERPGYKYEPVIPEYWVQFQKDLKQSKFNQILKQASRQINTYGESSAEGAEAQLTQGHALSGLDLNYGAFYVYLKIAKEQIGTAVGDYAIIQLADIVKKYNYDEKAIMQFVDTYDISNNHPDIQSFYSYFKSIHLLKFGFNDWAKNQLMQIERGSYWDLLRRYHSGLAMVAKNNIEKAKARFEELLSAPFMEKPLLDKVRLQLARIYFEQGRFKESNDLYESLRDFQVREKGRVLLEKSWAKFYLGDYSKALGILYSLNSPFFFSSINPERYILEMLIFKQLCHYDAARRTAVRYKKRFGRSIKTIRDRKDLKSDPVLFNMAVMPLTIQLEANLISQINEEVADLKKFNWKKYNFYRPLLRHYRLKAKELQMDVEYVIGDNAIAAANNILKSMEQVQFLDYAATIDKLSVEGNRYETYKTKKISKFSFEKLYWPVGNEYWFDELEDYKMQISSKCLDETDSKQLQLEESFR